MERAQSIRSSFPYAAVTFAGFLVMAAAALWKVVFLGGFIVPALVTAVIFLAIAAGLALVHARWIVALAAAVAVLTLVSSALAPPVRYILAKPEALGEFATTVLTLAGAAVAAVAGVLSLLPRRQA